jgi:hypothetical protein
VSHACLFPNQVHLPCFYHLSTHHLVAFTVGATPHCAISPTLPLLPLPVIEISSSVPDFHVSLFYVFRLSYTPFYVLGLSYTLILCSSLIIYPHSMFFAYHIPNSMFIAYHILHSMFFACHIPPFYVLRLM